MGKVEKISDINTMIDLFYANKHLHDKIKATREDKEDFEKIFKEEVDKLKKA